MSKKKKNEIVAFTSDESKRIGSAIRAADSQKVGESLIRTATDRNEKVFMENVLARVQELVSHRNNLYIAKDKLDREISLFDKRIAAVEKGEFLISSDGRLIYNDILLQY